MGARLPVHQVRTRDASPKRQTRRDTLGDTNDVGLHAVVVQREHLARATHAALHFIDYQEDAVLIADSSYLFEKTSRRRNVAAFALYWLDYNRGDFGRRGGCLE